jgi:hypothetical protein
MHCIRRFAVISVIAGVASISTGCLRAPVVPPTGAVYTNIKAPLDHDFDQTKANLRQGKSRSICVLGLIAGGDASIETAARNANLQVIHSADYEYTNILGIYQEYVTIVRGE